MRAPLRHLRHLRLRILVLILMGTLSATVYTASAGAQSAGAQPGDDLSIRPPSADLQERPLRLLFLGDYGHHESAKRAQEARIFLAERGIHLFYSNDLAVLTDEGLAPYDALLLYANHDVLTPAGEAALLDFVHSGKGFVPIHCASYCFRNSKAFVSLVGAQFQSHGTGTFSTEFVAQEHPILQGLKPIESWDETYVHTLHNAERTVLSVRRDGEHVEPWTWIREEGQGRVFYTAWGHDTRTWTNPNFQDLLERGIRWAAGDQWLGQPRPTEPFTFKRSNFPIPNYVANWQLGEDQTKQQEPLSAELSMEQLVVEPGLSVSLFASEPLIRKPITMGFGPRGRMWISETIDYPNERKANGTGRDRISILEDVDGDGLADRSTVFADGLSIPTGLCFANGGVVVVAMPDTLFLRDLDGDDVADEKRVLFTGWGTGDTHAGPSNLKTGPDGWIWGTVGYSGFDGVVGGTRHRFGSGIYRFRSDGSELEFLASTSNNTWGLGFSEEGFCFASTANGRPSQHISIENRFYESVRGMSAGVLDGIEENSDFHPVTDRVRQVDWHGRYTAAAGHALYTARSFPASFWNRTAFVCGPTGHLVGLYDLEPSNSHYVALDRWTLLASRDEWSAPISAEVGPDGAVWVIDWYNYIVQHNPTPTGFETGSGNAYITPLRDKVHGRIWRVTADGYDLAAMPRLERARPETLIAGLSHEVLAWRNHAQRILIEQGQLDVVPALLDVVDLGQVDSAGLATAGMHALWSMNALGAVDSSNERVLETLRGALSHPARGLRRAALQVLPRDDFGLALLLQGGLLLDTDPKVRLQALLTLSEMPASSTAAAQLLQLASSIQRDQDPELVDAITIAAANCDAEFLQALFAQEHSDQGVSTSATSEEPSNLAPNPSFEAALPGTELPVAWETRSYSGLAAHSRVEGGRTSSHSLSVSSEDGADASWSARIAVNPGSRYRFSAWIRTEGIEAGSGRGAQINVHELQGANTVRTEAITGTRDWTKVALTFEPGRLEAVTLNCLFGGWGRSQGTAWFDDVTLERVDVPVLPGALGLILGDVTRHYAGRAPAESVSATIASLEGTSEVLGTTVLNSLERGWRGKPAPNLNDTDRRRLRSSALNLQGEAREALALLLVSWDQAPLMGAALESVTAELLLCASDPEADPERRVAAARRMILLNDSDGNVRSLLDSIDLDTEPGLAGDLISLLSSSTEETTGVLLLEAITRLGPSAQAVAVETLCRRDIWTHVLLTAIQERELSANALSPSMWLTLENHPTPELAAFARDAHRSRPSSERMALVEEMLSRPALAGDVDRGALLYAENCAKCHSEGSTGRRLGPALDGIGKNPRGEVLASILDPNRAVEANYLMWIARTFDGQLTTGQLLSESRTAVEILESSGEVRILQREDIESIEPSTLSLMPEGFESLGDQALADLLEFLTGTH